jgi:membrane protein implicated in regulation of membrane protease activity
MKKIISMILSAALLCCVAFSLTSCGPKGKTLAEVLEAGELVVATSPDFPPFENLEGGEVVGIEVEIMALICEGITPALISIWFVPGAVIAIVLAALELAVWIQALVFFVVSIVSVVIFQSLFRKKLKGGKKNATNLDRIIGQEVLITHTVDNTAREGTASINDVEWKVKSGNGEIIPAGETAKVTDIEGVKLIVTK